MSPPKPHLTVRVGISGHRPNKLPGPVVPRIAQQLAAVFASIDTAAKQILAANAAVYTQEAPQAAMTRQETTIHRTEIGIALFILRVCSELRQRIGHAPSAGGTGGKRSQPGNGGTKC